MQISHIPRERYPFRQLFVALLKGHALATIAVLLFTGLLRPGANEMGFAWWGVPLANIPFSVALAALTSAIAGLPRNLGDTARLSLVLGLSIGVSLTLVFDFLVAPEFEWCVWKRNCVLLEVVLIWIPGNALGWVFFRRSVEAFHRWGRTENFLGSTAILIWVVIISLPCFEVGADTSVCENLRPNVPVRADCSAAAPGSSLETSCEIESFFSDRMRLQRVAVVDQCTLRIYWNPGMCLKKSDEDRLIYNVNLNLVETEPDSVSVQSGGKDYFPATWQNVESYQSRAAMLGEIAAGPDAIKMNRSALEEALRTSSALIDAGLLTDGHYIETEWCSGEKTYWPNFRNSLFLQFSSREDAEHLAALLHRYKGQACE